VVALGDSTTAGTPGFESPLEAPPDGRGDVTSQYAYWLMMRHPGWRVLNRGVNGERTDQIADRFDRDVLAVQPRALVLIAGVNDIYQGHSVESVVTNLAAMYERARAAAIPVIAGSIVPFNTATPDQNARMRAVNDWIRLEATETHLVRFAETRAAVACDNAPDLLSSSPDELHPSVDGYRRMAEVLSPILQQVLRK
jgi:lysophospholipase L1-like esterase